MDGHFGLYLELAAHHREEFHERAAEGAVAGHDVLHLGVPEVADEAAHETVAEVVEGAFVLGEVGGGEAVADDHIDLFFEHQTHHLGCMLGGIGVVAVGHEVAVGLHLAEHAADDVALALHVFVAHDGAGGGGLLDGAVGGVIVVDIDVGLGQHLAEIAHHLADGLLFVIARQQYRYLVFIFFHFSSFSFCSSRQIASTPAARRRRRRPAHGR